MLAQKVGREHYVFSLEMSKGGIGACVERYRGSPATRFSIALLDVKIKSFLPPPEVCVCDLEREFNAIHFLRIDVPS